MLRLLKCIFSFFCSSVSTSPSSFSVSLPFPHPSLCLSHSVSICLFLLVSADLSTCQLFLKTGPCAFLVPFFLFSVVFHHSVVFCRRQHTHMRFSLYTNARAHIAKLILSLSVSSTSSRCLALSHSQNYMHTKTHTLCQ